ncbi:type VI secretion system ImpA family N-terminal domain-containing protein [Novosphingobium sp. Chol11]|uniref:type VI secretion system protein TssA n=1 Tax=Novosphingobium sp. Chol11 TaxID=1385763 RepID=UPI0025E91F0C|nr:type VI secretion system ImpA family N-terminal domain-containing protein [Novosphingobium sp. Chol11]
MAIDIEALIAPISESEPSGPDLSYDSDRQEIEAAFDTSVSDDSGAASDVDWRALLRTITAQAEKTRDTWLAIYMMRAGAKAGQLGTIEDGAQLLAGLFENLWDSVHPQLDEYGFQGRKGPCEGLTRIGEFLNPLRNVVLLEHPRLGRYSGADFQRFAAGGTDEAGYGMFRALLEETTDEDLGAIIERLNTISASIRRADTVMVANAGHETGTNFQPIYAVLDELARGVSGFLRVQSAAEGDASDSGESFDDGNSDSDSDGGSLSMSGRINSRPDVLRAITAIEEYYTRKEPASPVPFALRRVRDWVNLDFMAILEEIAPGGLEEARKVLMKAPGT